MENKEIMTDEEADFWDEFFTKNTIMPDPNRPGVLALTGRILGDLDSDVAEYVRIQAAATGKTQGQVVSAIIRKELGKSASGRERKEPLKRLAHAAISK
jgi:hypothetical protein